MCEWWSWEAGGRGRGRRRKKRKNERNEKKNTRSFLNESAKDEDRKRFESSKFIRTYGTKKNIFGVPPTKLLINFQKINNGKKMTAKRHIGFDSKKASGGLGKATQYGGSPPSTVFGYFRLFSFFLVKFKNFFFCYFSFKMATDDKKKNYFGQK